MALLKNNLMFDIGKLDMSQTAIIFKSRKRNTVPFKNCLAHLSMIADINTSSDTVYDTLKSIIKPINNTSCEINFKDVKSPGLKSYLTELGRGIFTKTGISIGSGYFMEHLSNVKLDNDNLHIRSISPITPDFAAKFISYQIAKEMIQTVESLKENPEIQREAERYATNIILDIPNGKSLIEKNNDHSMH